MKKLTFCMFVLILAMTIMAPGTPGTPPVKKTPPPVETTEPPPVETLPVETVPPAIDTQPPVVITEPPVFTEVAETPWHPEYLPTREGKDAPAAVLPKGGYGPQPTPEPVRCLSALAALAVVVWRLGVRKP